MFAAVYHLHAGMHFKSTVWDEIYNIKRTHMRAGIHSDHVGWHGGRIRRAYGPFLIRFNYQPGCYRAILFNSHQLNKRTHPILVMDRTFARY